MYMLDAGVIFKRSYYGFHRHYIFRIIVFYSGKVAKFALDSLVRSKKICSLYIDNVA